MYPTPGRAWGMGWWEGSPGQYLHGPPPPWLHSYTNLHCGNPIWENDNVGIVLFYSVIYNSVDKCNKTCFLFFKSTKTGQDDDCFGESNHASIGYKSEEVRSLGLKVTICHEICIHLQFFPYNFLSSSDDMLKHLRKCHCWFNICLSL